MRDTVDKYRAAAAFFLSVRMWEAPVLSELKTQHAPLRKMELLTHQTKDNPSPEYRFEAEFYKYPSYYRRAAIAEALGKAVSYESSLRRWNNTHKGKRPGKLTAGKVYPALYRDNTFIRVDSLTAQVKVWIHNTWDWITIPPRKTDVSYIQKHC